MIIYSTFLYHFHRRTGILAFGPQSCSEMVDMKESLKANNISYQVFSGSEVQCHSVYVCGGKGGEGERERERKREREEGGEGGREKERYQIYELTTELLLYAKLNDFLCLVHYKPRPIGDIPIS